MNDSFWLDSTETTNFPRLDSNVSADVCVIGAGITGIVSAYLLNKQGFNVVLLDRQKVCSGVSARTTAKITSQHGLFYRYLIDSFGTDFAKLYLEANEEAIHMVKHMVDSEHIDCDFEFQDNFVYTTSPDDVPLLLDEVEAVQSLGFPAEFVKDSSLPFSIAGAVKFPHQAQFHVRKYLLSLLNCFSANNGSVFEHSKVMDIKKQEDSYITYTDNGARVSSKYVVLATHYPIINFPGFHFIKMYQSKSYVIVVDTKKDLFQGMYISSNEPTFSLKSIVDENHKRLLMVTGGDHKTGANDVPLDHRYSDLLEFIKPFYPDATVRYQWTTEDCISLDKLPYIGKFSNLMPHVFVATGFKKWGMSTSHVAAHLICDMISGKDNRFSSLFAATRLKPFSNAKEFSNMLKQSVYSLGINRFSDSNFSFDDLKPDTGGVVEFQGEKLGIYKDANGKPFAVIPYCKHLGCELSWNNVDKTWDCPCHGSRYDFQGHLITEPSKEDLDIVSLD